MIMPQKLKTINRNSVPERKKSEGLNIFYTISGIMWLLLGYSSPSLKFHSSLKLLRRGLDLFEDQLRYNLEVPDCLSYGAIINSQYLKRKHWIYAEYMATLSSLPILYKVKENNIMIEAILAKTAIGSSTKLLDNLNDSMQTIDEALVTLNEYENAMIDINYELPRMYTRPSKVARAANSSYVIGNWVPKILLRCNAPIMYRGYVNDMKKLVNGQIDSMRHKQVIKNNSITIENYLTSIAEKSIGDVWLDVDLCVLEDELGEIDNNISRSLSTMKEGYGWIFKSSLIYDDAQDLYSDIKDNAINSAILLGLKKDVIRFDEINKSNPQKTIDKLEKNGITTETIHLADMLFLKGIKMVEDASLDCSDIIDWKALLLSFRFVRLFNLRKILMRRKNMETLTLFIDSIRDYKEIENKIPEHIMELKKNL